MSSSTCLSPLPDMPLLPITSDATVRACQQLLVSSSNDIFICSYPKSGTTWTQNLVCRLLAAHLQQDLPEDWHLSHSAPFYEVDQYWEAMDDSTVIRRPAKTPLQESANTAKRNESNQTSTFRVFNTHLRPHQLPANAKCIYVVRDPLDVMASFYYHLANMAPEDGGYTGSPKAFVEDFLQGTVLYGKWQDHMEAWLGEPETKTVSLQNNDNFLLLHYDEMKEDLTSEATRVARFLGICESRIEAVVSDAVSHSTFEAMRQERWRYTPQSVSWNVDPTTGKPYQDFVRAGRIGDGKSFFNIHGTDELKAKLKDDLEIARVRWTHAGVSKKTVDKYLGCQ